MRLNSLTSRTITRAKIGAKIGAMIGVILCAGSSCASNEPSDDEQRLTTDAEEPAPTPTVSEQAAEALASCRARIDEIEQVPRDARVAFAVEVCRDIWLEEACADAFEAALALPSYERSGKILRDCRAAYCPTFEPDIRGELALCQAPLEDPVSLVQPLRDEDATDPLAAWIAFNDAIFAQVYGITSDQQLIGSFPRMLLQLVVVAPRASESDGAASSEPDR